ncbi:unnamed protein product [Rhodiola kirilowii]
MGNYESNVEDMSTLGMFDVPISEEYNQKGLQMLDAIGEDNIVDKINLDIKDNEMEPLFTEMKHTPLETVNCLARGNDNDNQLDFPASNDASDWMDTTIDEHMMENTRFDANLLSKGMLFATKELVLHACQRYSILNRVEFLTFKSDKDRLILICRSRKENCAWHVRAVKKKKASMWEISKYGKSHTCETDVIPNDNVHLNSHFIAMEIKDLIQKKLTLSPKAIKLTMSQKYGYDISYMKAWKARQKALEFLFGDQKESYIQLQNDQQPNDQPLDDQPRNDQSQNDQSQSNQPQNDQPRNDQSQNDQSQSNQPQNDQPQNDQLQNDQPQNGQPQDDQPVSCCLNAHELSSHVRSLVRSGRTAAEIFLNDPVPRTKKLAFDLFHASLADLVNLGEESALDIDPMLIQLSNEPSDSTEGKMPAKQSVEDFLQQGTSQLVQVDGQAETSHEKRKRAKRKLGYLSVGP